MSDTSRRLGAACGDAIAGYRDRDMQRSVKGLADIVAIVRELEERIESLEKQREIDLTRRQIGL